MQEEKRTKKLLLIKNIRKSVLHTMLLFLVCYRYKEKDAVAILHASLVAAKTKEYLFKIQAQEWVVVDSLY